MEEGRIPDHTFDQSRNNAVTPITQKLFLWTHLLLILPIYTFLEHTVVNVTRTGKIVTLVNLSLYEPETVLKVFNEIFYLMSMT